MKTNLDPLADLPVSPMSFKRCGECGCKEGSHSTACSKFDLRRNRGFRSPALRALADAEKFNPATRR